VLCLSDQQWWHGERNVRICRIGTAACSESLVKRDKWARNFDGGDVELCLHVFKKLALRQGNVVTDALTLEGVID